MIESLSPNWPPKFIQLLISLQPHTQGVRWNFSAGIESKHLGKNKAPNSSCCTQRKQVAFKKQQQANGEQRGERTKHSPDCLPPTFHRSNSTQGLSPTKLTCSLYKLRANFFAWSWPSNFPLGFWRRTVRVAVTALLTASLPPAAASSGSYFSKKIWKIWQGDNHVSYKKSCCCRRRHRWVFFVAWYWQGFPFFVVVRFISRGKRLPLEEKCLGGSQVSFIFPSAHGTGGVLCRQEGNDWASFLLHCLNGRRMKVQYVRDGRSGRRSEIRKERKKWGEGKGKRMTMRKDNEQVNRWKERWMIGPQSNIKEGGKEGERKVSQNGGKWGGDKRRTKHKAQTE